MSGSLLARSGAATALALSLLSLGGCYLLRYDDLAATHADLLEQMAVDAGDAVASGVGIPAGRELVRLRYPWERARQFTRSVEGVHGERESFAAIERLLERYAEMLELLEAGRVDGEQDTQGRLVDLVRAVGAEAEAVRDSLSRE